MAESDDLVGTHVAADHPVRQADLKGLIDNAAAPTEIGFTTRHEIFERQGLRHTATARLQHCNSRRGADALLEPFDLPDALAGIAAILLENARSRRTKPSREIVAKFLSAAVKSRVGSPTEVSCTMQHLFDAHFEDHIRMCADEAPGCGDVAQQGVQFLSRAAAFERIDPYQCAFGLH